GAAQNEGPHRYQSAGKSCLAGDVFGEFDFPRPLSIGDRISLLNAGGYTMLKKNWFNGVAMPAIAIRRKNGTVELVKSFDYADYVASLSKQQTESSPLEKGVSCQLKKNVLIIGAGGVVQVAAYKAAMNNDVLGDINIASRTLSKCEALIAGILEKKALKRPGVLAAHQLDAMDVEATKALIRRTKSQIVLNAGSAFLNMSVLRACIDTGVAYIDTAIHEDPAKVCETPPWYGNYEWTRREECERKGVIAILGAGFDPGVVNAYA